jgi:hypothetical protein
MAGSNKKYGFVKMFPDIINREVFLNRNHPRLDPRTGEYVTYWREEKRRCIEGYWAKEAEGHWRWMNPTLYYYINHDEILLVDPENNSRYHAPPTLDDNEWIVTNYLTAVFGFSGFTGDDKYTCHDLVRKYYASENGENDVYGRRIRFTKADEVTLSKLKYVHKSDGTLKEYMEPFEYLKLSHDSPKGYHLYGNAPSNGMIFTARSNGKSYIMAADCKREFIFGGEKYYDNPEFPAKLKPDGTPIQRPGEIMVGGPDPSKTLELCAKIEHGLDNLAGEYDDGEVLYPAPFSKKRVGTFIVGNTVRASYQKKIKGQWKTIKDGSFIQVVNYGTDLNAGASKRLTKQYVDEVGLLEGADEMHGVSKFSKAGGGVKFGSTLYCGTGGDVTKIDSSKKLFYSPHTYDIYSIQDYWENKGRIGLFMPGYYSLRQYKDENGNTLYEAAIAEVKEERERLAASADPLPLIQEKMFMPLVPSEMFYSIQDNIFTSAYAIERINELEEDDKWEIEASVGKLEFTDRTGSAVVWSEVPGYRKKVIKDLMLDKYADKDGAIVIYEHPEDEERVQKNLYKVVYDPYAKDGKGESYASVIVYKGIPMGTPPGRKMDTIVAEYLGRPATVEDAHKIAIQLTLYFGAKVLFEDNTQGFKKWCVDNKYFNLLAPEPWDAVNDGHTGKRTRTYKVGVTMTPSLKQHSLQLLRTWTLEPRERDDDGRVIRTAMHDIWSLRLLHEIVNFGDGNYDHISAMLLLMLWINQDGRMTKEEVTSERVDEFDTFFKQAKGRFYNTLLD